MKAYLLTKTCTGVFTAAQSVMAENWKPLDVHQQVNGKRIVLHPFKDYCPAIKRNTQNNTDESQNNYTE